MNLKTFFIKGSYKVNWLRRGLILEHFNCLLPQPSTIFRHYIKLCWNGLVITLILRNMVFTILTQTLNQLLMDRSLATQIISNNAIWYYVTARNLDVKLETALAKTLVYVAMNYVGVIKIVRASNISTTKRMNLQTQN